MAEKQQTSELTERLAIQPGNIRGVPSFVFSIPVGWVMDEAPNSLAVVHGPVAVDGFWPNLVISHDRLGASVDLKTAAQATWAKLQRQAPDAKVTFEKTARFAENVMYMRGVEMTSPQSKRKLGQLHGLCLAPRPEGAKTVDLFQLIATSLTDPANSPVSQFVEIIGSFRFI